MCKLVNVNSKVFGLIIPKDDNENLTTSDLLNNDYLIVDYNGYWVAYGATSLDKLKQAIERECCINKPSLQDSIRLMIKDYYSESTHIFTIEDKMKICFISNILGQLNIVYNVYSNLISMPDEKKILRYFNGDINIPNLSQIITAYGGDFDMGSEISDTLKAWLDTKLKVTSSLGTIIIKPDSYDMLVILSIFLVMTGYHFTEDAKAFYTNDDTSNIYSFLDTKIIIYDKIELQSKG